MVKLFALPIEPTGSATFDGKLNISFERPFSFSMNGQAAARGLGYRQDRLVIENADVRGDLSLGLDTLVLRNATATALGATINGQAMLQQWRDFHAEGNLNGLSIHEVAHVLTDRTIPWNATLRRDRWCVG